MPLPGETYEEMKKRKNKAQWEKYYFDPVNHERILLYQQEYHRKVKSRTCRSDQHQKHHLRLGNIHHSDVNPPGTEEIWMQSKYKHLKHVREYCDKNPKGGELKIG